MSYLGVDKSFYLYTFFQVSSLFLLATINLSFIAFVPVILSSIRGNNGRNFSLKSLELKFVYFSIGAIIVCVNQAFIGTDYFRSSLKVLPNYIYWVILCIVMIRTFQRLKIDRFLSYLSWGILTLTVYYLFIQNSVSLPYFLKKFQPNNFAFVLITFLPYVIYWFRKKYSKRISIGLFIVLLLSMLIEERRAGFVLCTIGGLLVLNLKALTKISVKRLAVSLLGIVLIYQLISIPTVKLVLSQVSPEVADLIYNETDLTLDRSLLTRKAMVEKGLTSFRNHPLVGIGLNNFTKKEVLIEGTFEGAEYVVDKDIFERTSSHNSYINVLTEGGLVLFIPFALIILNLLRRYIMVFGKLSDLQVVAFISMTMMLIHFYYMNAYVNSLAWFNIGIFAGIQPRKNYMLFHDTSISLSHPSNY